MGMIKRYIIPSRKENENMAKLFTEMIIKDLVLRNRIVMPPMCMYSAKSDGISTDWHYAHYLSRAVGGVGLIIQEATAVEERGRISDKDLGIWSDVHIEGLKKTVEACKAQGAKMGIQLGHAGRKCIIEEEQIIAPSPMAYDQDSRIPNEMSEEDIREVVESFKLAAARSKEIGYDILEIHGAHGYLINEFLSPLSNRRLDKYGGSPTNRVRFLGEIVKAVRSVWPIDKPLMVRVSAEDYHSDGNHPEDIAEMLNMIKELGVEVINVSSGAVVPAKIKPYPGYQIKFAEEIRIKCSLPVLGGGLITSSEMAEELIQNERADLVYLGRELLRNPYWPLKAAKELKYEIQWPVQYKMGSR